MNDETELYRQIHPNWIEHGCATYLAFRPTPKDHRHLSVYDGSQITPKLAWRHYVDNVSNQSGGVLAVTVKECLTQQLTPVSDPESFKEHAVIDFGDTSNSQVRNKAKELNVAANNRGWRFRPDCS